MKWSDRCIYFLDAFSAGLLVPVMSLVYLSHGATLETLSLFVAVAAVTIVIAELPSGMIADIIGRKKIFLLAHVFRMFSYLLLFFWKEEGTLFVSMIFRGIAMAFSSGSYEALLIEQYVKEQGKKELFVINRKLIQMDSAGCGVAAILGGILGTIGENYQMLLLTILLLELTIFLLSLLYIEEEWSPGEMRNPWKELKNQIFMTYRGMKYSETVGTILFLSAIMGLLISIVETYWQQSMTVILSEQKRWMLGFVSCVAYLCSIVGSKVGEKTLSGCNMKNCRGEKILCLGYRILLAIVIMVLGASQNVLMFIFTYSIVYILTGAGDLCERTILHREVENECRASMLSVYSLFIRGGAVTSSLLTSWVVCYFGISYVWFLIPMLALGCMGIKNVANATRRRRRISHGRFFLR